MMIPILLALACFLQEPQRNGQPIEPLDGGRRIELSYGFLTEPPRARIEQPGSFVLELETAEPTPPGRVYIGLTTEDEQLDWPRYRTSVIEAGAADELRRRHHIAVPFEGLLARMPTTPYEPRVNWRAEFWLPAKRSSRFVEGRVWFDPHTHGDTTSIISGPSVDRVGPRSAVVSWETDRPADGHVWIAGREVRSKSAGTRHEVLLDGLHPATRYGYRVQSDETLSGTYAFRTAPVAGPFRFAAMVDSREGVGGGLLNYSGAEALALRALVEQAYHGGAQFVLFAGDLVNGYTTDVADFRMQLDAWKRAVAPVRARLPFYTGMGNHESVVDFWRDAQGHELWVDKQGSASAEAAFARAFVNPDNGPPDEGPGTPSYSENVYWFDWGDARFFVLNNNYWWSSDPHLHGGNLEGYVLPRQLEWLRQRVAEADRTARIRHLFFAAQEPPFPNGGHTADAMWHRGGDTNRDGVVDTKDVPIVEDRNELWAIVASSPKTVAFLTGDEHSYSRLLVRPDTPVGHRRGLDGKARVFRYPVWQVTSGGAGAPWYDVERDLPWSGELRTHSTQPHVALFEVDGGDVRLEVFSQTGQVLDRAVLRQAGRNRTD